MSTQVSRAAILWAIVRKDMLEYSRERFFVVITVIGILFYALAFWLLPSSVNESFAVGVRQTGMDAIFTEAMGDQSAGIEIVQFESIEALEAALGMGDAEPEVPLAIGLAFPDDFPATRRRRTANHSPRVRGRQRASGTTPRNGKFRTRDRLRPPRAIPCRWQNRTARWIVPGEDRVGDQVPFREKIRPLFAVLALVIETFALSSLIATEIQARTVTAVLVSPTRVSDFLAAKGILGTAMAFAQAVLLLLIIGSFANQPLILLCALLLGAVLVTGFGLIAGAAGKDFIETLFFGMAFMIPLMIPAIRGALPRFRRGVGEGLAFLWLDTSSRAGQRLQRRLAGSLAVSRHVAGMVPARIRDGMGRVEAKSGNAIGMEQQ